MRWQDVVRGLAASGFSVSLPEGARRAPKLPAMALSSLQFFTGVGAVFGGVALLAEPRGGVLHMPVSLLARSPFSDFFVPGLVLAVAVGGTSLLGGYVASRRHPWTGPWAVFSGLVLVGWILAELAWLGYLHWLQPFYLALGLLTAGLGRWILDR